MFRPTLIALACCAALAGCASSPQGPSNTAVGAVQAVYVEVAPDIYVSEQLMTTTPARDYWVKVTLGNAGTAMARVPASLRLQAGDEVALEVADALPRDASASSRRANRVLDRLSHGALARAETRPRGDVIDRYLSDRIGSDSLGSAP